MSKTLEAIKTVLTPQLRSTLLVVLSWAALNMTAGCTSTATSPTPTQVRAVMQTQNPCESGRREFLKSEILRLSKEIISVRDATPLKQQQDEELSDRYDRGTAYRPSTNLASSPSSTSCAVQTAFNGEAVAALDQAKHELSSLDRLGERIPASESTHAPTHP